MYRQQMHAVRVMSLSLGYRQRWSVTLRLLECVSFAASEWTDHPSTSSDCTGRKCWNVRGRANNSLRLGMDQIAQGFLTSFAVAIVSAIIWHAFVSHWVFAIVGATFSAVLTILVMANLFSVKLDTFFALAIAFSAMESLVVAALVGIPFKLRREAAHRRPQR